MPRLFLFPGILLLYGRDAGWSANGPAETELSKEWSGSKMKPGFTLLFSMDGVSLLQRAAGGWRLVGTVAMDQEDPADALARLRAKGEQLSGEPLACKLVIPNEQIRYISVATGETEADERLAAVQDALQDATPYSLEELAYDFCPDGETTHAAAVAIETLAEAETFATENGFLPASFVAAPGENAFLGEPFFGTTRAIRGTEVEPDGIAVVITGDAELPAAEGTPAEVPVEANPADTPAQTDETEEPAEPKQPAAAEVAVEPASSPKPAASQTATAQPADEPASEPPEMPAEAVSDASEKAAEPEDTSPGRNNADTDADEPAPEQQAPEQETEDEPVSAPQQERAATSALAEPEAEKDPAPAPKAPPVPDPAAAIPPAPALKPVSARGGMAPGQPPAEPAAPAGFATRRRQQPEAAKAKAAAIPVPPASASAAESLKPGSKPAALPASPLKLPDSSTKPVLPQSPPPLGGARTKPAAESLAVKPPLAEAQAAPKRRFLGLALTAVLLLAMAAAALLTRAPQDTPVSEAPPAVEAETGAQTEARAGAEAPAEAPALTAEVQDDVAAPRAPEAEQIADAAAIPSQDISSTPADAVVPALDAPALEEALRPDELISSVLPSAEALDAAELEVVPLDTAPIDEGLSLAALYAATGVWQAAPDQPGVPALVDLDSIYVASIDHTGLSQDAVALPGVAAESLPQIPRAPAAAPEGFDLDERGLVTATPEGTLNPDGIMVYLGKPPVVPPQTPDRPDPEAEAAAEAAARQVLLSQSRPRLRPDDLVERAERAQLGGLSRAELASKRPRLRPASLKTEAQESQPPTAQAVATSVEPRLRPSNFANIVNRARKNTSQAAAATAPAAAPATVTPSLPTAASVARQATQENAINLRKINLIGVFGTTSDRRALVRMPAGSYRNVKVGDRLDGGRVVAIGDTELRYEKGGRNLILRIPNG